MKNFRFHHLAALLFPQFLLLPLPAFAYRAHEHGVAKIDIAFDGLKGVIHFESPASSIYGFEHEAKSKKDKRTRDSQIDVFKNKFSQMLGFDSGVACAVTVTKVDPFVIEDHDDGDLHHEAAKGKEEKHEGTHSEVQADFAVTCGKTVTGTNIHFAFQKFFPAIKKISVQVINGDKQNGATIVNDKGSVGL